MAEHINFRKLFGTFSQFATILGVMLLGVFSASPLNAQIHGIPPSVTSIPNHVPPYGVPNIPPSATSLGPYGYCCQGPSNIPYRNPAFPNRYNRRGNYGYGSYGYGYGYAVPYTYLYPSDDSGYYGGGGGPYLYSGPPQSGGAPPTDQTLHIIVDSAPQRTAPRDEVADAQPEPARTIPDAKPGEPTTLVFRDGHKQEVTNYAIMGQTLYVFDNRTKKIALADLDVPATIKANDDEGVEFQVPKAKQSSKPAKPGVPRQSAPDDSPKTSSSMSTTP
ncbi:MAG: hypothetical protein WAM71_04115 [Candidatus Korobacteraceae bacterium]